MADSLVVHVAVGLLVRDGNQVLVARRRPDSHQGGLWEFPGGKIEPGEAVFSALCREFSEELDVIVRHALPLTRIHHDYGDKSVLLDVWTITDHEREPYGKEGQEVRWQAVDALKAVDFPAANGDIIRILQSSGISGFLSAND